MADLSAYQFNADINAFAKAIDLNQRDLVRMIVMRLWNDITGRTPVDTGRARAAWGVVFDDPNIEAPPEGDYGPPPQLPAQIEIVDGTQVVFIINAVEYIEALEDGHSKRSPAGMVRVSLASLELEMQHLIQKAAKL